MRPIPSLRRQLQPLRGLWFCAGASCGWFGLVVHRPWAWIAAIVSATLLTALARGWRSRSWLVAGLLLQQTLSWSWAPTVPRSPCEGDVVLRVEARVGPGRCESEILVAPSSEWIGTHVRTEFGKPGDTLRGLAALSSPRPATVPGGFDERGWMASAGLDGGIRWRGDSVRIARGTEPWRERLAERVRGGIRSGLHRHLSPDAAALWTATLLAENAEIPRPALEAFQRSGLFHMLSVGGFHMVVLGGTLMALLSLLRVPRRHAWIGAAFLVCLYAWILGSPPSVSRAAGAFAAAALALAAGRRPHAGNALFTVLGLLVVLDPNTPFRMAAQLTFVATASLLWLSPSLHHLMVPARIRGGRFDRWILLPLAASIAATLATAPILAWNTGMVSWIGVPAGLVGASFFSVGFLSAFAVALLAWLPAWAVSGFAGASELCARVVWEITLRCGEWRPGSWTVGRPSAVAMSMWFAGLLLLALLRRRDLRTRAVVGLAVLGSFALWLRASPGGPRALEVVFLDVGQGSATLVRWPSGRTWLLDAGPRSFRNPARNAGNEAILPALRLRGVDHLDAVSVSHADLDHWGGLPWLADRLPPSTLFLAADSGTPGSPPFDSVVGSLVARGWSVRRLQAGQILSYGDGARAEVVSPGSSDPRPRNQTSLVWRLRIDSTAALVPGDADSVAEAAELLSGLSLHAQVLAAGHHGSRHSSSLDWVRAVGPRLVVLSYGDGNRYGHPNAEVLDRIGRVDGRALRTPEGSVLCVLDGRNATCRPAVDDGIWSTTWSRGAWTPPWIRGDRGGAGRVSSGT